MNAGQNRHGRFSDDGTEYVITDPRTPRPWANLIANPRIGLAVSQTGSGFSWIDNSQQAAIVRWQQELADDRSGRFLYLLDRDGGRVSSLAPAPCGSDRARHVCRHGLGYTTFESEHDGVKAIWTLFVDAEETVEIWKVSLAERSGRARRLALVPFLEWNCGTSPAPRREFQKLFLETRWLPSLPGIVAGSHMWDVGNPRWGHWNTPFPYWSALASAQPVAAAEGDKAAFLGRGGDWRRPAALDGDRAWPGLFGRHYDPVAALRAEIDLAPNGRFEGGFVLATSTDPEAAAALASRFADPASMADSYVRAVARWRDLLSGHRVETPEPSLNRLANDWLRYQAISARLWGRAGYYQQSGAFGFRDQLQDSQVWLTIDPERCREQIDLHARHQFADGSVYHWWHPLTEQGHVTAMTDDLLWLGLVSASYAKETGDLSVLDDRAPYLDEAEPAALSDHVGRAFSRVFSRTSERGLPLIGAGDWNDGLSSLGLRERGESVWLGWFLVGLLADWAEIARRRGDTARAEDLLARRAGYLEAIEEHAWDGGWYRRATRDDGTWIGSAENRFGRIFLNAQTWAVLSGAARPERAAAAWAAVRKHLVCEGVGALLLAPAWAEPDETVGYITRYAPGLRENGGVYTHAATWAIAAAAAMNDAETVEKLLAWINPSLHDPETYWAEPYVLPGNVDGPESPYRGRAGWTWYTGSAAWLPRILAENVLGVRPTWDGLLFDPCLPASWPRARMRRPYRGATLEIEIERQPGLRRGETIVEVDGRVLPGGVLAEVEAGAPLEVRVACG